MTYFRKMLPAILPALLFGFVGFAGFYGRPGMIFLVAAVTIMNTLLYPYSSIVLDLLSSFVNRFFGGENNYGKDIDERDMELFMTLIFKLALISFFWMFSVIFAPIGFFLTRNKD